jgi:hypothetical protein
MGNDGNMRQIGNAGNLRNLGFWFGRKPLRPIDLNPIPNAFWFDAFRRFLEMLES